MRINNNISAVNSHRQLGLNTSSQGRTTERLSSGLRVNRAADDAAGLAISEKMRTQIRGLNRASLNIQDGISLLQTAEGGMQGITSMLQRQRELIIQALNDTNEELDRDAIQLELDQLRQEVDATAFQTHFNGTSLLNGGINSDGSIDPSRVTITARGFAGGGNEVYITIQAGSNRPVGYFDITPPDNRTGTFGASVGFGIYANITSGVFGGFSFSVTAPNGDSFSIDVYNTPQNATVQIPNFGQIILDSQTSAQGGRVRFDLVAQDNWPDQLDSDFIGRWIVSIDNSANNANLSGYLHGGLNGHSQDLIGNEDVEWLEAGVIIDRLWIQSGANSGDGVWVGLHDMRAVALGVDEIFAQPRELANASLEALDRAINRVSMSRATVGAQQNRLEFAQQNVDNTSENLSAAESRIRDTDMAREMTQFTKDQILVQSSIAMLSQANAMPQSVLQLLG